MMNLLWLMLIRSRLPDPVGGFILRLLGVQPEWLQCRAHHRQRSVEQEPAYFWSRSKARRPCFLRGNVWYAGEKSCGHRASSKDDSRSRERRLWLRYYPAKQRGNPPALPKVERCTGKEHGRKAVSCLKTIGHDWTARISEYKDKTELFKVSSKPLLRVGKGKLSETFGTGIVGNRVLPMGC